MLKHSNTHIQDIYLSYLRCKEAWRNFGGLKEPMNNLQLSVSYAWFQRPFLERFLPAVFSHHFPNTKKKNTYSFKPVILWRFCSKFPLKIHWIFNPYESMRNPTSNPPSHEIARNSSESEATRRSRCLFLAQRWVSIC